MNSAEPKDQQAGDSEVDEALNALASRIQRVVRRNLLRNGNRVPNSPPHATLPPPPHDFSSTELMLLPITCQVKCVQCNTPLEPWMEEMELVSLKDTYCSSCSGNEMQHHPRERPSETELLTPGNSPPKESHMKIPTKSNLLSKAHHSPFDHQQGDDQKKQQQNQNEVEEDESQELTEFQYEVVLFYGAELGLHFVPCPKTGFLLVSNADDGNKGLPGMHRVHERDLLIAIDDVLTNEMSFDAAVSMLQHGIRPCLLRFQESDQTLLKRELMNPLHVRTSRELRRKIDSSFYNLVWREEDGPLGMSFSMDPFTQYPCVTDVADEGAALRESNRVVIQESDLLISINGHATSLMGYENSILLLQVAPKPLLLTLRRATKV